MKFILVCVAALAIALIVGFLPPSYLPDNLASRYYRWFGVPAYRALPPSRATAPPPITLDEICSPAYDGWRDRLVIDEVPVAAVSDCMPDNPWDVAVSVRGANNVSQATLMRSLFTPDAVQKSDDRDGDGDPDRIEIRLEVMELNGKSPDIKEPVPQYEIGPGITPGFWVFAPKSRGMTTIDFESLWANRMIRLPAPVIRIEQGDEVHITLENSHYLPHTIHFHGLDHPFKTPDGSGNDGVPLFSEQPTMPGAARTYWLQPRQAGTTFYHCHVQPHTHILMGLQGMLVVEENRPNNWVQTFNIGAGRVRAPSVASREAYAAEYDLHYLEIDAELNNQIQRFNDPRLVSRAVHRGYRVTERQADYFVLNGRSFPYTLREGLIVVDADARYRLRVLNGGSEGLALHFHGHKPRLTHRDGIVLAVSQQVQRDVFWIASAQRADFELRTENDGINAYGPGAWLLHDHREQAVTTAGIGPGGDVSLLIYREYLAARGLPQVVGGLQSLAPFFSPAYYRGEMPVFAGMMGQAWSDPVADEAWDVRSLLFWTGVMLLTAVLVTVWHRARGARDASD